MEAQWLLGGIFGGHNTYFFITANAYQRQELGIMFLELRSGLVNSVAAIKRGQVDLVVDQVIEAIFKCPGQDLSVKVDRYELPLRIIVLFVSRHTFPFLLSGLPSFSSY